MTDEYICNPHCPYRKHCETIREESKDSVERLNWFLKFSDVVPDGWAIVEYPMDGEICVRKQKWEWAMEGYRNDFIPLNDLKHLIGMMGVMAFQKEILDKIEGDEDDKSKA